MKRLSHILVLFFAVMNLMCLPAMAADSPSTQTIFYEDGSYAIVSMNVNPSARSTAVKDKTYTYHNSQGQRCFTYTIYGTFTYNGVTSRADSVDYRVVLHRQGWDLVTHSEYVSGNTAYGRATFTGPNGESRTASLTLTCDKKGTIS